MVASQDRREVASVETTSRSTPQAALDRNDALCVVADDLGAAPLAQPRTVGRLARRHAVSVRPSTPARAVLAARNVVINQFQHASAVNHDPRRELWSR